VSDLFRPLSESENGQRRPSGRTLDPATAGRDPDPYLVSWAKVRRGSLIAELHSLDDILLAAGELRSRTLPRRPK